MERTLEGSLSPLASRLFCPQNHLEKSSLNFLYVSRVFPPLQGSTGVSDLTCHSLDRYCNGYCIKCIEYNISVQAPSYTRLRDILFVLTLFYRINICGVDCVRGRAFHGNP